MKKTHYLLSFVMICTLSACPSSKDSTDSTHSPTPTPSAETQVFVLTESLKAERETLRGVPLTSTKVSIKDQEFGIQFGESEQYTHIQTEDNNLKKHYYYKKGQLFLFEELYPDGKSNVFAWDGDGVLMGAVDNVSQNEDINKVQRGKDIFAQSVLLYTALKAPEMKTFKGIVTQEDNHTRFHLCKSTDSFELKADALPPRLQSLNLMEREPAYVEFKGTFKDRRYTAYKLLNVSSWKPGDGCFTLGHTAKGHHPEWSLTSLVGKQVFFKADEGEYPAVEHFAYSSPVESGNKLTYRFQMLRGPESHLDATFTRAPCLLDGKTYNYQVNVKYFDAVYSGCGS